jgi:hypothetical protein
MAERWGGELSTQTDLTQRMEISGIMGAGYLPRLLQELSEQLRENFWRRLPDGRRRTLVTRYHNDNTALRNHDPEERERVATLITRKPKPGTVEWQDLIEALRKSDELFEQKIYNFPKSVDIALRRGGLLQSYILLDHPEWEEALLKRKKKPKLQVFLYASLDTISASFSNDADLREKLEDEPAAYCKSAQEALEQQERWMNAVQDDRAVICMERKVSDKRRFAMELARQLRKPLEAFGCGLIPKGSVFISYSTKDEWFASRLHNSLTSEGISSYYALHTLPIGANIRDTIYGAIRERDFVLPSNCLGTPVWGQANRRDWIRVLGS